ncbi:MAG: hypothetical protein H6563_07720 [Lewinellaceae bacterium]|nr:hypothetical protein [Lewinellaceae bacterium]
MKITALLLFLGLTGVLFAQDPVADRLQIARDQNALQAKQMLVQSFLEKQPRLTEAISDGDLESAAIMKEEILELMDQQIAEGNSWVAADKGQTEPLERLKAIREKLAQFPADAMGAEKASEAGNLVTEFVALMGRMPF